MTKISNQYSLTNILTADLANSRLGINNVSPTVALDVTGAGKFSGALTGTTATFRVSDNRNLAIKYDTNITLSGQADSGAPENLRIYADTFKIFTSTTTVGLTERLTISNTGNVGIGTSSPDTNLTVWGANVSTASASAIANVYTTTGYGANVGGSIGLGGYYNSTANITYANIHGKKENATLDDSNGYFAVSVRNASAGTVERMRINSVGQVKIGTNNNYYSDNLVVYAGAGASGEGGITIASPGQGRTFLAFADGTGGEDRYRGLVGYHHEVDSMLFYTNATTKMTISSNGSIGAPTGTNIYNASDARLKKNISTTTYGLDAISALNPVKFNWVDGFEPTEDGKDMLGFIAQEMQNVIPEAVESFGGSVDLNGTIISDTLRVNEKFIIPVLVKAIQELSAKVSLLENK